VARKLVASVDDLPGTVPDLDANDPLALRAGQAGDRLIEALDGRFRQLPGGECGGVELRCDTQVGGQLDRPLGARLRARPDLLAQVERQRKPERDDRDRACDRESAEQTEMNAGSMEAGQGGLSWRGLPLDRPPGRPA
jgi:hypothetical protein